MPVDKALQGALNLGKSALDAALTEVVHKGRDAAVRVADRPLEDAETLRQLRVQYGFDEIALYAVDGKLQSIATASSTRAPIFIDKPNVQELRDATQKISGQDG